MRFMLSLGCAAALVAVAACNRSAEEAPVPGNQEAAAVNAAANVANPADIATLMHDRHENYEAMGKAMKGIGGQLKSEAPSVEAIQRHAALIARYAPQIPGWFPHGSGPETGRRTRAKAEIWTDSETFRQRAEAFALAAARFDRTTQTGDLAAIRAGQAELGKACKNCHDRFRGPEHEHEE